ncbi:MAG: hypothetical protein M1821_007004 [Bathelium mastoideum]|nr:MAG: hypothetical protein M1821_007004 [Bathelium mastoideum]
MGVARTLAGITLLFSLHSAAAVLVEKLATTPKGWTRANTPSGDSQMVLQIALAQQNLDQLESKLASVSTPGSATYGQYLNDDELNALFGASKDSATAVTTWLQSSGVTKFKTQGDSIWFQAPVSTVNSMLGTTFHNFADSTGSTKLRTTQYSVPDELAAHIDLISPTTFFGKTKAMRAAHTRKAKAQQKRKALKPRSLPKRQEPASCELSLVYENETFASFGPACLKTQYSVNGYKANPRSGSRIGFGSFLNESASFSDVFLFEKYFNIPAQNFSVVLVNPQDGATALPQPPSDADDGEANLDSQYIVGLAHPLPFNEFITAGSPPYFPDPVEPAGTPNENEPYLPYYEFLLAQPKGTLPAVITNSYGDEEQTVPENYAKRVCNLIGQLGLRGISVFESSGDEGVGASCLAQNSTTQPQFNPIFPATCPYLTSVGGTVSFNPEVAWDGSSGGFSNYFKTAWYQKDVVTNYLNTFVSAETKEYYGQYVNFSGRGFPDVSAHSVDPDYTVFQGGLITPSGGTSAASPVTASIIALVNDARLRAGKPTLGFLNPLIYAKAYKTFTDITSGQSDGCNGNDTQNGEVIPGAGVIPGAHWNATVGWDPVTGFGTPNFEKFLAVALNDTSGY